MWVRLQVKISDDMESGHSEEAGLTAFTLVQYENKRVGLIIAIHPGVLDVSLLQALTLPPLLHPVPDWADEAGLPPPRCVMGRCWTWTTAPTVWTAAP